MFQISFAFDSERGLSGECAQMGRHSLDSRMDKQGQRGVAGKKDVLGPKKKGMDQKMSTDIHSGVLVFQNIAC